MPKIFRRDPCNPLRDFVVRKPFLIFNKKVTPGQPFDKLLASERRLRQMYDQYMVDHAPVSVIPSGGLAAMPMSDAPIPQHTTETVPERSSEQMTTVPLTRAERVRAAKRARQEDVDAGT